MSERNRITRSADISLDGQTVEYVIDFLTAVAEKAGVGFDSMEFNVESYDYSADISVEWVTEETDYEYDTRMRKELEANQRAQAKRAREVAAALAVLEAEGYYRVEDTRVHQDKT